MLYQSDVKVSLLFRCYVDIIKFASSALPCLRRDVLLSSDRNCSAKKLFKLIAVSVSLVQMCPSLLKGGMASDWCGLMKCLVFSTNHLPSVRFAK